ncbi:MAG: hypothetical protein P8J87_21595, partial [Verrucomicrobiales bacterium]|nr:hypothetical protein [Verrucomicrobiales bacterium]
AEVCYRRILQMQAKSIPALNSLTWLLATAPDEGVRDGEAALKVAKILEGSPVRNHPAIMDTVAAAYAAAGYFKVAVTMAERAIERGAGDEERAARIGERLQRYRAGEAWVRRAGE